MISVYPVMMILLMNGLMTHSAATNSTMTPRPANGTGNVPGRSFSSPLSDKILDINGRRYKFGDYISKGSFGSVYEATTVLSDGTPMKVAIKLIMPPRGTEEEKNLFLQYARKEINFLKEPKDSANVVTIIDSEEKEDSSVAIVMEYCTGTLRDWMKEHVVGNWIKKLVVGKGLPSKRVIDKFVPFFSSAVRQMRDKDIVHIDMKPANILRFAMFGK